LRVHMDDIRTNSHMYTCRHIEASTSSQDTKMDVRESSGTHPFSYRPTDAHSGLRDTGMDSSIEKLSGFSRHAKAAIPQRLSEILRSYAMISQFNDMHDASAVHRPRRQHPSLQQIDDER